jgi:hypothetical protein
VIRQREPQRPINRMLDADARGHQHFAGFEAIVAQLQR